MKQTTIGIMFVLLTITAGCSALEDDSSSQRDTPSIIETTEKHATAPMRSESVKSGRTPSRSPQEQEYIESGRALMQVVGARVQQVHAMDAVSRKAYPNNSVKITVRLNDDDPIYKGMMNVTQTFSVVLPVRTSPQEEKAFRNGTSGKLHRPEKIYVDLEDPGGDYIGRFQIISKSATKYRYGKFDANVFAQKVINTLQLDREWKKGSYSPSWYLNRSELADWVRAYKLILQNETDPNRTIYKQKFPVERISIRPEEMRVHHKMRWKKHEMGTGFISAQADIHTAYWITTDRAWSKAPVRLSHYMNRPGVADIRGNMDLESVYWLLERQKNNTNLNAYLNMDEGEAVDDE